MIDFRRKDMVPASSIMVVAILVLFGTFIFMAWYQFISPPNTKGLKARVLKEGRQVQEATMIAKAKYAKAKAIVDANTWSGTPDEVAPAAMAKLSSLARANGVKLTAFRPQRSAEAGPLTSQPYLLTLEGTFPSVVQLTRQIDKPGTKLSVNLVQINASSEDENSVTATVGVVAYLMPSPKPKAPASTTNSTPRSQARA